MPANRSGGVLKRTPSNYTGPSSSHTASILGQNPSSSSSALLDLGTNLQHTQTPTKRRSSRKRTMPVQISQEVIEISSDEDDTPSRRRAPQPSSTASDLRKEVRRLKDSNALFKGQVENLQNELDAQLEKVRSLEMQQRISRNHEITLNYSEVDDIICCSICSHPMLLPYMFVTRLPSRCPFCIDTLPTSSRLPACGHTFCQKCLSEWFDTTLRSFLVGHPHYNPATPMLPHMAFLLNHPGAINNPAIAHLFPSQPEYTCPECRAPVKTRPVENFGMKSFVKLSIAAKEGKAPPTPARPRGSPWEGFFPQPRT